MSAPIQQPTLLMLDKAATLQRVKERKNEIKKAHFASGGSKRTCPVKQSKSATLFSIFSIYLAKFDSKKKHKYDNSPRVNTQHKALGSKNDASGRTMQRHLNDLITHNLLRGYQRMQRGVQILLPPDLLVWADVPEKWHPRPANSRPSSRATAPNSFAAAGVADGAPASQQECGKAMSEGMAALARVRDHFGQLSAKIAQNSKR